ncbi:unnamed protein product [Enterobius vermicularis]|uniref:Transmembrane protein 144 n=1 Tax=Enterobius vermicularis TaxID=51028 RepID=A0A0N4VNE8_ENTVE|nr:unnamed protein product [Enterobius vermicularis]
MCAAIFLAGMVVNVFEDFSTFHPLAMLGGSLWAIGNATAIPIISMIGMGPGMLIWGTINCIVGWATSRFGLFGFFYISFWCCFFYMESLQVFKDVSPRGTSYVFANQCGIFVTSTLVFLLYVLYKRSRPVINPRIVLPAFITGGMWSIAQISCFILNRFVANDRLSQAVSFPIISMLPGVCAAAWSVFYFREIEDRQSLRTLAIAVVVTVTGAALVGLSKELVVQKY